MARVHATYTSGSKPMGSHFGAFGAPPVLEPILVVGLVDVHWGHLEILTHGHFIPFTGFWRPEGEPAMGDASLRNGLLVPCSLAGICQKQRKWARCPITGVFAIGDL